MDYDGIIFDLDGTLWDATKSICDTWNLILSKYPELNYKMTVEKLHGCMGLTMYDIAAKLFPELEATMQRKLMDECCENENEYLSEHGGTLYEGVEDVLSVLSQKYPLFIVSNCQDGYIEAFFDAHGLSHYFKDTECWGRTRLPKSESNKILIQRNHLKNPIYVGDTEGDRLSAVGAGIKFIFAKYGFGDTKEYDDAVEHIAELKNIL